MCLIGILLVLILGAFLSGVLFRIKNPYFHGTLSTLSSSLALVLTIKAFLTFKELGEFSYILPLNLIPSYNFDLILKADPINLFFALFGAYVSVGICLYSIKYMTHEKEGFGRFYFFIQLFIASYLGLTLSENLVWSYIFFELTGLCSYQLISFWYGSEISSYSARKAFIITHIAGYGFLLSVIMISSNPENIWIYQDLILVFLLVAVVAKSVQWPLYTWIPYAMNAPTPVSALLHAACLVKCGIYLMVKFYLLTGGYSPFWQVVLIYLGMGSSLIGVLFALKQDDIKKLLAYHTVSQIGYMVSGIGLGTPLGIASGVLHALNHALFKGLLFLVAGILQQVTSTRSLSQMGGLASKLPLTTLLYLIGACAISGIPGFNGFVSKWLFYHASLQAGHPVVSFLGLFVSTLTTISFIKVLNTAFLGTCPRDFCSIDEKKQKILILGAIILGGPCIILGLYPQIILDLIVNPLLIYLNFPSIYLDPKKFPITLVSMLALISIFIGIIIYILIKKHTLIKESEIFTGGKPEPIVNPSSDDLIFEVKSHLKSFYDKGDPDLWLTNIFNRVENVFKKFYTFAALLEKKGGSFGLILAGIFLTLTLLFAPKITGLK